MGQHRLFIGLRKVEASRSAGVALMPVETCCRTCTAFKTYPPHRGRQIYRCRLCNSPLLTHHVRYHNIQSRSQTPKTVDCIVQYGTFHVVVLRVHQQWVAEGRPALSSPNGGMSPLLRTRRARVRACLSSVSLTGFCVWYGQSLSRHRQPAKR